MIEGRVGQQRDVDEIRQVNDQAFGQAEEGRIVDKLHISCQGILSIVPLSDHKVIGHVLFSPVTINGRNGVFEGMGLSPMAVLPELQNRGIGSRLVSEGLRIIRNTTCPFVIVLDHEKYYPRFGFQQASKDGPRSQWEGVPDEAVMVMILDEPTMRGISGIVRYRDEVAEAM